MTAPEQIGTQESNGAIPPALASQAYHQSQSQYQDRPEPSYIHVIEDVDMEEIGKPYDFKLPARIAEKQTSNEARELAGRQWRMANSQGFDWQELADMEGSPNAMLERLLGRDQYREFEKIKGVEQALIAKIMDSYRKYFGLGGPGK